jgi:hypothetical protein
MASVTASPAGGVARAIESPVGSLGEEEEENDPREAPDRKRQRLSRTLPANVASVSEVRMLDMLSSRAGTSGARGSEGEPDSGEEAHPPAPPLPPPLTQAQTHLCDCIARGGHVCATAHAGTGKTTTLIEALRRLPWRECLFLEFNRALRLDAADRVRNQEIRSVNIQNYDSVLVNYYNREAPNVGFELAMERVVTQDRRPYNPLAFDVLVVDEAQDMTELYFRFLQKVLRDNPRSHVQLVVVGDFKQTINGWRGAKDTFMRKGAAEWSYKCEGGPSSEFVELSSTFRFGSHLSGIVNLLCSHLFKRAVWKTDLDSVVYDDGSTSFVPNRGGDFHHFVLDPFSGKAPTALLELYADCVRDVQEKTRHAVAAPTPGRGAHLHSVGLLAYSTREDVEALWHFIEHANDAGIEHRECGENDVHGGVTLRTLHTTKGKEFTHVFLFLVERSMWLTGAGNLKRDQENLLYVGLTRARKTLVVVESCAANEKVFSEMWKLATRGNPGAPSLARDACTGAPYDGRVSYPMSVLAGRPKRCLTASVLKNATMEERLRAMDSLEGCARLTDPEGQQGSARLQFDGAPYPAAVGEADDDDVASDDGVEGAVRMYEMEDVTPLETLVTEMRLEYALTGCCREVEPLLTWCGDTERTSEGAVQAYIRLSTKIRTLVFLAKFETWLRALPRGAHLFDSVHWETMGLLHSRFHYGHLTPAVHGVRARVIDGMLQTAHAAGTLAQLNPIVASGCEAAYPALKNFCLSRFSTFVSVDGREVSLLVAVATETLRAEDVLAACAAAHIMETDVTLHYLANKRKFVVTGLASIWDFCAQTARLKPLRQGTPATPA